MVIFCIHFVGHLWIPFNVNWTSEEKWISFSFFDYILPFVFSLWRSYWTRFHAYWIYLPFLWTFLLNFVSLFICFTIIEWILLYPFLSFFFFFFATSSSLQDFSSLTGDWTWTTAVEVSNSNHWTAKKFPNFSLSSNLSVIIILFKFGNLVWKSQEFFQVLWLFLFHSN